MGYIIAMWMLRRARSMPLYATWGDSKTGRLYVDRAEPAQVIAIRAIEIMAQEALERIDKMPRCPCCGSTDVTLERNAIARWVQCHYRRCGMTHHAATNPEVDTYFEEEALCH